MSKAWMPLYIGDYLADTQHLTAQQHGAYLLLIMHYWTHGGLPDHVPTLRAISLLDRHQWRRNCEAIASMFQPGWKHKRIDSELEKARVLAEKRAVLGSIGGRYNKGLNNAQRHLRKVNGAPAPKAMVAQSQSHKKERGSGEEKGNGKLEPTSGLEAIIRAKGWV